MDEIEQYLQLLERHQNAAINRFNNINSIERKVVDHAFKWLIRNLDIKQAAFVITEDLPAQLNDFVNSVTSSIITDKSYSVTLKDYLADLKTIGNNIESFQTNFNKIDFDKAGIKPIQKAMINDVIDQYTENGLNRHFAAPLKDLVYRNVLAGTDLNNSRQYLQQYILSGNDNSGKLGQYLTQTAQQGVDSYQGAINTKLAQTFDYTGYIISGSLIKTSSTQCRYAIEHSKNGYLTNEEWKAVFKIAEENKKAPLIEGTTLENLDTNKLHWGCRHTFTPVIM